MTSETRKWTILIYQAGDNNLSEECVYALKEMKKVGTFDGARTSANFEVLVQFDPAGRGNRARRFRISKAGGDGTVVGDTIFEFEEEIFTGDPKILLDFLCDGIERYPAEYYMVVLSGHGAGVMEGFFLQDEERPFSSIPSSFPITKLRGVFENKRLTDILDGRKIDILGFDACMMSMVELCFELRYAKVLDFVVGGEGFSLNSGWPLERLLIELKNNANQSPEALAHFLVNKYARFYSDYYLGGLSVDQSVIRLPKIRDLKHQIDNLASALIRAFDKKTESSGTKEGYDPKGKPFQDAILLSHWAAQSYNGEQCVDLYDFCDLLQLRCGDWDDGEPSVRQCCQDVKDAIGKGKEALVRKTCTSGSAFQFSRGVSIYFPWAAYDLAPSYVSLDFAKNSSWLDFLKIYLKNTQRQMVQQPAPIERYRSTPPTSKGPEGRIHSMRNPPTEFPRDNCITASDEQSTAGTNSQTSEIRFPGSLG